MSASTKAMTQTCCHCFPFALRKRPEGRNAGFVLDHSPETFSDLKSETSSLISIFQCHLTAPSHASGQPKTSREMNIQGCSGERIKVPHRTML